MSKRKFRTWDNFICPPGEVNNLPSQTIPNEAMTLRELLDRYSRGQGLVSFTPVFQGEDDDLAMLDNMDRIDRASLALEIKNNISKLSKTSENAKQKQISNETNSDFSGEHSSKLDNPGAGETQP